MTFAFRLESIRKASLAIALTLTLTAFWGCGGSSSSTPSGSTGSGSAESGIFADSGVEGMDYRTETHSGLTGPGGTFSYESGETVTFSIGNLVLGQAAAAGKLTPMDLVSGATDVTDVRVTNICRLLQTLDTDGDPGNGIKISSEIRTMVSNVALNFEDPIEDFAESAPMTALMSALNAAGVFDDGLRELCSVGEAQLHLRMTLEGIANEGGLSGNYVAVGYSGDVWTGMTAVTFNGSDQYTFQDIATSNNNNQSGANEYFMNNAGWITAIDNDGLLVQGVFDADRTVGSLAGIDNSDGSVGIHLLVRSAAGLTAASLTGTYYCVGFGVDGDSYTTRLAITFDGAGSFFFNDLNTSFGHLTSDSGTYTIDAGGRLQLTAHGQVLARGQLAADGSFAALADTNTGDGGIAVFAAVKSGTGLGNSLLDGFYVGVNNGSDNFASITGATLHGDGTADFKDIATSEGYTESGTATYTVDPDGGLTAVRSDGDTLYGAVSPDGAVFILVDTDASDGGLNMSVYIKSANTPPIANIIDPADGETFQSDQWIHFEAAAGDWEDGELPESAYVWSSSIDGQFATGSHFEYGLLSQGEHTITLTVTDSQGASHTQTVTLTVDDSAAPACSLPAPDLIGNAVIPEDPGVSPAYMGFDWTDVAGADHYHIRISPNDDLTTLPPGIGGCDGTALSDGNTCLERWADTSQWGEMLDLIPSGTYYWSVVTVCSDQTRSNWSEIRTFTK